MDILLQQCTGRVRKGDITNEDITAFYDCDGPKFISTKSMISSVYWIEIPELETATKRAQQLKILEKFPWFEALTFRPKQNGLIGASMGAPISVWYTHPEKKTLLGMPRYMGLSCFGKPLQDKRNDGNKASFAFSGILKSHQEECTTKILDSLHTYNGATLVADCGVGKTAMALYITSQMGCKVAIVCNRELLMEQWADSISKFLGTSVSIALLQGTADFDKPVSKKYLAPSSAADILICSINTLATGNVDRSLLAPYGLVIVDEMHHLAAASLVHVIPQFQSRYTLGLTATPTRRDGLEYVLYWLMGPAACVYQRVPEITGVRGSVEVRKVSFTQGLQKEIVYYNGTLGFSAMITELSQDPERNALLKNILFWCAENRNRTIVVSSLVEHVKLLASYIPGSAIMAGKTIQRDLAKSANMVFATYSLLEEGYDDPSLDTLVLCTPRSNIQQTIGRIEREHPGKAVPLVIDIVDMFSLFPNMFWKRQGFYKTRGFKITDMTS